MLRARKRERRRKEIKQDKLPIVIAFIIIHLIMTSVNVAGAESGKSHTRLHITLTTILGECALPEVYASHRIPDPRLSVDFSLWGCRQGGEPSPRVFCLPLHASASLLG